jgi:hypothetical protein
MRRPAEPHVLVVSGLAVALALTTAIRSASPDAVAQTTQPRLVVFESFLSPG